eukprot:2772610-Rhodomonas_salina.2
MSGTDIAYLLRACYAMSGANLAYLPLACYAMSGTGIAHGAVSLAQPFQILFSGSVPVYPPMHAPRLRRYCPGVSAMHALGICYAHAGTEVGYDATSLLADGSGAALACVDSAKMGALQCIYGRSVVIYWLVAPVYGHISLKANNATTGSDNALISADNAPGRVEGCVVRDAFGALVLDDSAQPGAEMVRVAIGLRGRYAMSGTEIAYAATRGWGSVCGG